MPVGRTRTRTSVQVQILGERRGPANRLGEQERAWEIVASCAATVQPLGEEQALAAGLKAGRERLRVWLYTGAELDLHHRLRLDGVEWRIVVLESWTSYRVVIAEHLEG